MGAAGKHHGSGRSSWQARAPLLCACACTLAVVAWLARPPPSSSPPLSAWRPLAAAAAAAGSAAAAARGAAGSAPPDAAAGTDGAAALPDYLLAPVLISYSYFEKDEIQLQNFEFFLRAGTHYPVLHRNMHWVFVINGDECKPCAGLYSEPSMRREAANLTAQGILEAHTSEKFTALKRANEGMDFAAHNATLAWLAHRGTLRSYPYFFFLNSSVKGPYLPIWLPPLWHWTASFMEAFQPHPPPGGGPPAPPVHAVGSSLVCLPSEWSGESGRGPRLESWAFALDAEGLEAAIKGDVFKVRTCKFCKDRARGVVVGGEYGVSLSMFESGYNIASLMSRYARGIDWTNQSHWACNDNIHPSRVGLYAGISQHPYETVFVKSSWHVADPYTRRYSRWALQHLQGEPGTDGQFNSKLALWGILEKAKNPPDLDEAYTAKVGT